MATASTAPSSGAPSNRPGTLAGHHSAASVKTLHASPRPPPRMRSDTNWNVSDARHRYRRNVTGIVIDPLLVNGPLGDVVWPCVCHVNEPVIVSPERAPLNA